jgi:membrane fusion protein, copper/silver efflux system
MLREKIKKNFVIICTVLIVLLWVAVPAFSQHEGHGGGGKKEAPVVVEKKAAPAQASEEPATVEIPPEKQQLIGVKTVQVAVRPMQKVIRTVGKIEYDEKKLATVNLKFEGWIEKLYVDYTGRYVKAGEALAEIYSPELLATQQEYLNVLKMTQRQSGDAKEDSISRMLERDSKSLLEAARQRLKLWDISERQIEQLEKTGKPSRTLTLYSPVSGFVVQKAALQGMRVMPGEKLFDLADLSTVWIISDIYQFDLPFIRVGDTARMNLSYFPGKEFSARIDFVYPALSGETRTAKVRFSLPNRDGRLKPQMFTDTVIKVDMGKKLAIPEAAVINTGTRQIVYVDRGEGKFEPREVILGARTDD